MPASSFGAFYSSVLRETILTRVVRGWFRAVLYLSIYPPAYLLPVCLFNVPITEALVGGRVENPRVGPRLVRP